MPNYVFQNQLKISNPHVEYQSQSFFCQNPTRISKPYLEYQNRVVNVKAINVLSNPQNRYPSPKHTKASRPISKCQARYQSVRPDFKVPCLISKSHARFQSHEPDFQVPSPISK